MGVYVFRCRHAPYVKLGHHKVTASRPNVYYRVAGRGFHSCAHPRALDGKLSIDDLELLAWYPALTRRDEGALHRLHRSDASVGEFHPADAADAILRACDARAPRVPVSAADRAQALAWAKKNRMP